MMSQQPSPNSANPELTKEHASEDRARVGKRLYEAGQYDEAKTVYLSLFNDGFTRPSALFLARITFRRAAYEEAVRYASVLKGDPALGRKALETLARSHHALQEWDSALSAWIELGSIAPSAQVQLQIARLAHRLMRSGLALSSAKEALRLDHTLSEAAELGLSASLQSGQDAAAEEFAAALARVGPERLSARSQQLLSSLRQKALTGTSPAPLPEESEPSTAAVPDAAGEAKPSMRGAPELTPEARAHALEAELRELRREFRERAQGYQRRMLRDELQRKLDLLTLRAGAEYRIGALYLAISGQGLIDMASFTAEIERIKRDADVLRQVQ